MTETYVTGKELQEKIENEIDVSDFVWQVKMEDKHDFKLGRKGYKFVNCRKCKGPIFGHRLDEEKENCVAEEWSEEELSKIKEMMITNGFQDKVLVNPRKSTPKKYARKKKVREKRKKWSACYTKYVRSIR